MELPTTYVISLQHLTACSGFCPWKLPLVLSLALLVTSLFRCMFPALAFSSSSVGLLLTTIYLLLTTICIYIRMEHYLRKGQFRIQSSMKAGNFGFNQAWKPQSLSPKNQVNPFSRYGSVSISCLLLCQVPGKEIYAFKESKNKGSKGYSGKCYSSSTGKAFAYVTKRNWFVLLLLPACKSAFLPLLLVRSFSS